MDARKRNKIEAKGWKIGTADQFLELTAEESALLDLKMSLSSLVRSTRQRARLSQEDLADRLHSSQSRVAKLEAGDASVSLDLIVKAAFAAGAKKADLAQAISKRKSAASG